MIFIFVPAPAYIEECKMHSQKHSENFKIKQTNKSFWWKSYHGGRKLSKLCETYLHVFVWLSAKAYYVLNFFVDLRVDIHLKTVGYRLWIRMVELIILGWEIDSESFNCEL